VRSSNLNKDENKLNNQLNVMNTA